MGFETRAAAETFMHTNAETVLGAVHFVEGADGKLEYLLQSSSAVRGWRSQPGRGACTQQLRRSSSRRRFGPPPNCHHLTSPFPPCPARPQPKQFKSYVQDPQIFWQMPVMSAVSRELARQSLLDAGRTGEADGLAWDPTLARFPHPEMTTLSLTGRVISPCIFAACMFGAVTQMAQLVSEKDSGLRQAMRTMGLMDSSYWASWIVFDLVFGTLLTLVIIVSGADWWAIKRAAADGARDACCSVQRLHAAAESAPC
jgi:hypothetical protein